jgi:hypothetical protein
VKKKSKFESSALKIRNEPDPENIKITKTVISLFCLIAFI